MAMAKLILSVILLLEIIIPDSNGVMVIVQVMETKKLSGVGAVIMVVTPNGPT